MQFNVTVMGWVMAAATCWATLCGCGASDPQRVPTAKVSGKVTLGGQPLAGATVNFVGPHVAAIAKTDDDGCYTLRDGTEVGDNRVYISKIDPTRVKGIPFSEDPENGMDAGQLEAMNFASNGKRGKVVDPGVPLGEVVPPDYSSPDRTILRIAISEDGTDSADFAL